MCIQIKHGYLNEIIKVYCIYLLKEKVFVELYCFVQASKSERQKKSPTYKDLDFMEHHPEGIFLEADTYTALVKTIQRDCRVSIWLFYVFSSVGGYNLNIYVLLDNYHIV